MPAWRSIRTKLIAVTALPLVALLVLGALAVGAFNEVRVKGDNYNRIIAAKDVVADVLPPPEYIVESYLTVLQLAAGPAPDFKPLLTGQLDRLERQFQERHEYWDERLENPQLRQALLVDAYEPAVKFYRTVNEKFLPAIARNDLATARTLADKDLYVLYGQHRTAIERVVDLAVAEQRAIEAETDALVLDRLHLLAMLFAAFLLLIGVVAATVSGSIARPVRRLRRVANEELPRTIEYIRSADLEGEPPRIAPIELGTKDELAEAAKAFNAVVAAAVDLAATQARLRRNMTDAFVSFGRRNQNLVARQLRFIDQLERAETDPQQAANLFRLDHLATRIRRNAESLLVLAGVDPPRKWRQPVPLVDVVRSALGEVEEYTAVRLGSIAPGAVSGLAVADLSHLLAELIENAIRFSPPESPVVVNGGYLDGRYHLAIIDQGMGLAPRDLQTANERLGHASKDEGTPTGNLGLFVVARLAARHGIRVQLESEGGVGTTAWVTLPATLFEAGDERSVRWSRAEPPGAVIQRPHPAIADGREKRHHSQALPRATGERPVPQGQHSTLPQGSPTGAPHAQPLGTSQAQPLGAPQRQPGRLPTRPPRAGTVDVPSPAAAEEPTAGGSSRSLASADDSEYTAAGFPRRRPNAFPPGTATEKAPTAGEPPPSADQPAADVRDRYRRFAAGKRHAQDNAPPPGDQPWP